MTRRIGLGLVLALVAATSSARESYSLDRGWRFHPGDPEPFSFVPAGTPVAGWRWMPATTHATADESDLPDLVPPPASGTLWSAYRPGDDVFQGRKTFAWFRTDLPDPAGPGRRILFSMVDDDARVWLNGARVGEHRGWNDAFDLALDVAWKPGGPNVLTVLVGNSGGGPGRIGPATVFSGAPRFETPRAAGTAFTDSAWRLVDVPHDYVVEGTFDPKDDGSHGFLPRGVGWYRRTFALPESRSDARIWLEFDGVYRDAAIWVNGALAGRHASGYTSFHLDVTDLVVRGGRNVVAVRCDAAQNEGWWYEGGGIYRHVRLTTVAPMHIDHWGVQVTAQDVTARTAKVRVRVDLKDAYPGPTLAEIQVELNDPDGRPAGHVRRVVTTKRGGGGSADILMTVADPQLWSPAAPRLYTARVTTEPTGEAERVHEPSEVDRVEIPFGIRTFRFDAAKGFFLNGEPIKLQGTCNHQDFAGVGVALPDRLHEYKIEELKRWGANAYRCSHHPPAPEILDACDRLGVLVMDENRHLGDSPEILGQVEAMVKRDRNHPSVVIWSTSNEEGHQGTDLAKRQGKAIYDLITRLDGTRPITSAMNQRNMWGKGLSLVEDVQGTNYNPEGYDEFHASHPKMPMVSTESHSTTTTRGIYWTDTVAGFVTSMKDQTEYCWRMVAERPFVAGTFVWTGFDYRGEPTPYQWPCISSHFGFLDTCGIPKDDAWYYKAWWRPEPSVHLFPHWNAAGKVRGQPVRVRCYGNTAEVELLVNGTSAGKKPMPRWGHLDWDVPYAPGEIEARGTDPQGVVTATDRVETTGAPAAIRLVPDRTDLKGDGEDVALVRAEVVDAKGRVVPDAGNEVTFAVDGPGRIIGVGNGNPSSHEPDKAPRRRAFNGRCLAIVQAARAGGELRLAATSPGLVSASATLTAAAGPRPRHPELSAD